MEQDVKLNRIETVLTPLSYPITPTAAADELRGVTVELAEGTVDLGETIGDSDAETFESANDLELEFVNLLPRHAVGEPYQSEGDA